MPAETAADRLAFLSADEFGATATYTPAGGAAAPDIAGQFDDPFLAVAGAEVAGTADRRPTFFCRAEDLPGAAAGGDAGDTLAIDGGATYRVIGIEPDGTGMALLTLGA